MLYPSRRSEACLVGGGGSEESPQRHGEVRVFPLRRGERSRGGRTGRPSQAVLLLEIESLAED